MLHRAAAPVSALEVSCAVNWERRFDHMQQHTGQHLLSAVFVELHGANTVSFHLGEEAATIDLDKPALGRAAILAAEERANAVVFENRAVSVAFEDASDAPGLRKPTGREGTIRIIGIDGMDRSACGGTHVRATGEIGAILIRKLERIRDSLRVEFLCGARATRRARADFDALSTAAQAFSASLDDTPGMALAHLEAARAAEKRSRRLEADLARYRGRELYDATAPGANGVRVHVERAASGGLEGLRALAQSFTSRPGAVFVGIVESPASALFAVSEDAGIDAGQVMKAAVARAGGRGGGTARIAQGSVPEAELATLVSMLIG